MKRTQTKRQSLEAKLLTLEKSVDEKRFPMCICTKLNGEEAAVYSLCVLSPFLSGEYAKVVTDDENLYDLLKAFHCDETEVLFEDTKTLAPRFRKIHRAQQ